MLRHFLPLSTCALLLVACGGGGGPSRPAPVPDPAFAVTTTSPADGATGIARTITFSASFNRAVAAASVGDAGARLLGPEGNAIPVGVSVNGSEVSLVPPLGLPGNTTYRVELAASIADAKGATLAAPVARTFTTAAQSWQPAAAEVGALEYFTANTAPMVRADRDGNVTAVWQHSPSRIDAIFAARMDVRTGAWSAPVRLAVADATGGFGGVRMTTGAKGEAYVSWTNYGVGPETVRIQRYDPATGTWSELPAITAPANASGATLVTDAAGNLNAIVAGTGIHAVRFDAAAGKWAAPVRIDNPDQPVAPALDLTATADDKGNLIVGWVQYSAAGRALVVTRTSGGTWSALQQLDSSVVTSNSPSFSLSVNASGSAVASWAHDYGMAQQPTLMASVLPAGTGTWGQAVRLDSGNPVLGVSVPRSVIDDAGIATALWAQNEGLYASRYSPATGSWSAPQRLGSGGDAPAVADTAGNVTIVQAQDKAIVASQYRVADGKWHDSIIGQPAAGSAEAVDPPAITIDAGGTVTAAWFAWTTVDGVWRYPVFVNRFK